MFTFLLQFFPFLTMDLFNKIKDYIIVALVVLLGVSSITNWIYSNKIDSLTEDLIQIRTELLRAKDQVNLLNSTIDKQNSVIEKNKLDEKTAIIEIPKEVVKIQTKYKVVYVENNASCDAHLNAINQYIDIFNKGSK